VWTDWVHAAVRAAFLSPGGCWWDLTAALAGLPPVEPPPAAPTPFWAGLIDPASPPTSTPSPAGAADLPTAGAAAATSGRSLNVTGTASPASVDVAFADLTAPGDTVDGRIGMLAAVVLRGGGILAVLTRCHHASAPNGALVDPTGAIVAAAQNADLLYLQHIVIPTGVIPTGPLLPPRPHPTVSPPQPPDHRDPDPHGSHDITHIDLLVFAQPHKDGLPIGTPTPVSTNAADDLRDDLRDDQSSAVPVRAGGDAR